MMKGLIPRRNLAFEFSWNVDRDRFFEHERYQKGMHNEMANMLNDYQTDLYQESIRNETLTVLQQQYSNTLTDINRLRQGLETTIDGMNILVIKPN